MEMLPATSQNSRMIFFLEVIPLSTKLICKMPRFQKSQWKLNNILEEFNDIMTNSSSDTGYTKLIEMKKKVILSYLL